MEPAFRDVGHMPGLELWRIQDLTPVKQTIINGHFHKGNAYILLSTFKKTGDTTFERAIHIWWGSEASQNEVAAAARKTVELDDAVGGAQVHYREIGGHESALFLSYFKDFGGLRYLAGADGFAPVERDGMLSRLLQVEGLGVVRATEVPTQRSSLNAGGCFLLDTGLKLFLWNGPGANCFEKAKALELAMRIKDAERGGQADILAVNELDKEDEGTCASFWDALGGDRAPVTVSWGSHASNEAREVVLARITSGPPGDLTVTPISATHKGLKRSMLASEAVFVLDAGASHCVWAWVGKAATETEKREGLALAVSFVEKTHRSAMEVPVVRVMEGSETAAFISHFAEWDAPYALKFDAIARYTGEGGGADGAPSQEGEEQDETRTTLAERLRQEERPLTEEGDGPGTLRIWRIEKTHKVEVPLEEHGLFEGGSSYLVLHSCSRGDTETEAHSLYLWQGAASKVDEEEAWALLGEETEEDGGSRSVGVRVLQGHEPAHFRRLFQGRLVLFAGGVGGGCGHDKKRESDASLRAARIPALFRVKGLAPEDSCAVEVPVTAQSLNSENCFILSEPGDNLLFVWWGTGATPAERDAAMHLGDVLYRWQEQQEPGRGAGEGAVEMVAVEEGEEPDEFWTSMGGLATYPKRQAGEAQVPREPRLFALGDATGSSRMEEMAGFVQADLDGSKFCLLDTYRHVFVWVGDQAQEKERKEAWKMGQDYLDQAMDGRDPGTPLVRVSAGCEPSLFTQHFADWDVTRAATLARGDAYEERLARVLAERVEAHGAVEAVAAVVEEWENEIDKNVVESVDKPVVAATAMLVPDEASEASPYDMDRPTSLTAPTAVVLEGASHNSETQSQADKAAPCQFFSLSSATTSHASVAPGPPPPALPVSSNPPASSPPSTPSAATVTKVPTPQEAAGDPTRREAMLSDEEFAATFKGRSKVEFYALPKWKQVALKKQAGLF